MNIEEDSAQINVLVGEASKIAVGVQPSQKIDVIVGDAAKMDCTRAINYIKSGTAEIDKAVEEGIEDFNANAVAKTNAFNTNATNKTNAFDLNASNKTQDFNDNATSKTTAFNDNATSKTGDFNSNATDKTNTFNQNATDKTGDFNTNATNKTKDFNDNYSDKLSDFNGNATDKTNDFNSNASDKTQDFNDNYVAKKQIIDDAVSDAQGYASDASNSAIAASSSADLAKQWAIGDPTEPTGNSAKYWADEASTTVANMANKDLSNLSATGEAKFDAKQDVISDLATIRAGAALGATSVQSVTTGTTNGTIKVDGNSVSVYGLGSAAYTASTAYDASGSATTAETNAKNYADSLASNYATAAQGALADTAVQPADLATVATTGDYDDLLNKPTIPAAQVNSDWNANSGVAQILNKPSLATVATSGAYSDLSGTPTIPTVNNATLTVTQNGVSAGTFTANASSDVTIALTDTTYSAFTGADGVNAGSAGLVPAPAATDNTKYLKGDGTWDTVTASASWGSITGTLSNQTDLDNALSAKADTDLSNLTATGKSYGAELSMPSDSYVALTPVADSQLLVQAPANGYVFINGTSAANGWCAVGLNVTPSTGTSLGDGTKLQDICWEAAGVGNGMSAFVPVKKGDKVWQIAYAFSTSIARFIYAEGEI